MSNTFGHLFRITSFGESHGAGLGVVIDGCPAGLKLDLEAIQLELDRRRPGQSRITTQRKESDRFELLSGTVNIPATADNEAHTLTTGSPMAFLIRNENARSKDYSHIEQVFRPSHADYTYYSKYGVRDHRGGGRSSARETVARVIGGAVAKQLLQHLHGMQIGACVYAIGGIGYSSPPDALSLSGADSEMVRCPDPALARQMVEAIEHARKAGDSLGGIVYCSIENCPPGLGEPVYNKLHAALGAAMLGINAVKGFEIGSGFAGAAMRGSEHNDTFYSEGDRVRTHTNRSGGVQGGISNGEAIYFKVAFKPTSTIMQDQASINVRREEVVAKGKGRHDPCVVPRAVPIVEAMAALVMADFSLLGRSAAL